jgi:polyisoprenoid-binding protein YceI
MKKFLFVLSATLLSFTASFAQKWAVDKAHSRLGFAVSHLSISEIDGSFKDFDATITSSKEDFSDATFEISATIASINTEIAQRDQHLQSPDFFDAAKYPTLTFKSTSFKKTGDKTYKLTGDFTLHGVTKSITLDVVFNGTAQHPQSKKTVAGFKFTSVIKRSDFGVATKFPAAMLGDDVQLIGKGEFVKD